MQPTIPIATTRQAAVDFLREPANLPRWAVGFVKSARQQDGQWLVATGSGEVAVRVEVEPALGVVDFYMSHATGGVIDEVATGSYLELCARSASRL